MRKAVFLFFIIQIHLLNSQNITQNRLPCLEREIPIMLHLLKNGLTDTYDTDSKILNAINDVNQAFKPICISFKVIDVVNNPNYNYFFNLSQETNYPDNIELFNLYNKIGFINIYTSSISYTNLNGICEDKFNSGITIKVENRQQDAVSLDLIKLLARYLGLENTTSVNELADGSNGKNAGDSIDDTPADYGKKVSDVLLNYYKNIPYYVSLKTLDVSGAYTTPMIDNYMASYFEKLDLYCKRFTYGQYQKLSENVNKCLVRP